MIALREGPQRIQETLQGSIDKKDNPDREKNKSPEMWLTVACFQETRGRPQPWQLFWGVWFGAVEDSIREVDTNN